MGIETPRIRFILDFAFFIVRFARLHPSRDVFALSADGRRNASPSNTRVLPQTTSRMSTTHLLVTLRRGTAGKPKTVLSTLASLGLRRTRDARLLPNDEGVRGKLNQVKHLVRVETLEDAEKRLAEAEAKRAAREPLTVTH